MELLDWRRLCRRSLDKEREGLSGQIVFYRQDAEVSLLSNGSSSLTSALAALSHVQKEIKVVVAENDRVYACVLIKENDSSLHLRKVAGSATRELLEYKVSQIVVDDKYHPEIVAESAVLSSYTYDLLYRPKDTPKDLVAIVYAGNNPEVKNAILVAEAQNFCRFLGDTPANLLTPSLFCSYAKDFLPSSLEVEERDRAFLKEKGMNLLLGVSNGSEEEPKLLEIHYRGRDDNEIDIALIGKGITFDSGGISLKPSEKMSLMKGDMLGGASVLSTMGVVGEVKPKKNIVALVPLTENLPSGKATKPGDVHIGMGGISVEVDNTDAEGRLILGDALSYSLTFGPKSIIDIATLTGAISISLGTVYAGLFSNNASLKDQLIKVGEAVDDPLWSMPCSEEYGHLIKSSVADLKNTGGRPAGSITAALFLSRFAKDTPWAHIDIAGVMAGSSTPQLHGDGMTGRPVRLLSNYLLMDQ